jgi:hypothetical protein
MPQNQQPWGQFLREAGQNFEPRRQYKQGGIFLAKADNAYVVEGRFLKRG